MRFDTDLPENESALFLMPIFLLVCIYSRAFPAESVVAENQC